MVRQRRHPAHFFISYGLGIHRIHLSNLLKRIPEPVSNRFVHCLAVGLNPRGWDTVTQFYKLQLVNPLLLRRNLS